MILIAHRGNINGINKSLENSPEYLDSAIDNNYNIELDIWYINNNFWTGHYKPEYYLDITWLKKRIDYAWIHCKDISSLLYFKFKNDAPFNFFWHEKDVLALTSLGFIWAYPGKQPIANSIAVLPELNEEQVDQCIGICSDYITRY